MASKFTISVKAARQGDLKGETGKDRLLIPVLGFSYGVTSPRDVATGQASGKRQHKPLTIYKEWGVISTELLQALVTNESLVSVVLDEWRANPQGIDKIYMEIRLINAQVSAIQIDPERLDDLPVWQNKATEAVSFVFHKIEIENKVSKTMVMDDWEISA